MHSLPKIYQVLVLMPFLSAETILGTLFIVGDDKSFLIWGMGNLTHSISEMVFEFSFKRRVWLTLTADLAFLLFSIHKVYWVHQSEDHTLLLLELVDLHYQLRTRSWATLLLLSGFPTASKRRLKSWKRLAKPAFQAITPWYIRRNCHKYDTCRT